jgi:hypothetical protein
MLRRDPHQPSERELTGLADGSLVGHRRARVEALVATSPKLQALVREQRDVLDAIDRAAVCAPRGLRTRVATAPVAVPRRARRIVPAFASAGVVATVAVIVLATIGSGAPTVAQAASLALRPPRAAAPAGNQGALLPRLSAAGLPFPYWKDRFGWRATGVRRDNLSGRSTTTVFYRRARQTIAYTIVSGPALAAPVGARVLVADRIRVTVFRTGRQTVATWLRRDHSCVLSGTGVPGRVLVRLAAFRNHGMIPY